jgi:hypothetical protein
MARSVLEAFVSGTRQVLTVQLIVSVAAIALAGWTLSVTSELIRERDRLRERVIQLEETMGASGIVVPETPAAVVDAPTSAPAATTYPGEIGPGEIGARSAAIEAAPEARAEAQQGEQRDLGRLFGSLFAPAPPMRLVVLHVRSEADGAIARAIAEELQTQHNVEVVTDVLQPRDPRQPGYTYFDGRQGRAAAALVTQFHDLAREKQIAAWTAQLRGVALPAQGEYTADRIDLVLPTLPVVEATPPSVLERVLPEPPASARP